MIIFSIDWRDPAAAFSLFAQDAHAALFSSVEDGRPVTYIAVEPSRIITAMDGNPLALLEKEWRGMRCEAPCAPVAFTGGMVGFFGYELGGTLEKLPAPKPDAGALPLLGVGIYETITAFDHARRQAWVIGREVSAVERLAQKVLSAPDYLPPPDQSITGAWQPEQTRETVEAKIRRVVDYIRAGDIFQANYTQRFAAQMPGGLDAFDLYRRLHALSPAPYAAFLKHGDIALASASPECFLRLGADGLIETCPIKGTRPRDDDPARDALLAHELLASAKDNAENLMIVDLMRSDIGRVAEIGSVSVPRLCTLESFACVHHLVSAVEGRLRKGLTPFDLLRATFPGGSVTGAPKIRAMEIIHELELAPRGLYCGCYGWIGFDGAMGMAMTIRALTITRERVLAQAGGGITADSDPAAEYEESMVKIAPLLCALDGKIDLGNENDRLVQRRAAG